MGEFEVVVLGGGPAGIAAAFAASLQGRDVLLVERYGFLGGMGTAAGVTNFCGLHANVHGDIKQVVHGVADELLARIDRLGGLNPPHLVLGKINAQAYDTAAYKCAADDLLLMNKVSILFHALATGVAMDSERRIKALLVETKSGRFAVLGKTFIDCSGDGDLAAFAGAAFEAGGRTGIDSSSMIVVVPPLPLPRTSSSFSSAVSSSTFSAKVSSDTRIWRALPSMRFSPADRPLSFSRIVRFRTTSATW
jgi:hypothetical protein